MSNISVILTLLTLSTLSQSPSYAYSCCDRSIQLDNDSLVRIWQPAADVCLTSDLRAGGAASENFPTRRGLKSVGPRWLALQLKWPALIRALAVIDTNQWRPTGGVRVLGALAVPLGLQLEDPCNTSWDALGGHGVWKPITDGAPVAYILLSGAEPLTWDAINITYREPPLRLKSDKDDERAPSSSSTCSLASLLSLTLGDHVCFSVIADAVAFTTYSECCGGEERVHGDSKLVECFVRSVNGPSVRTQQLYSRPIRGGGREYGFEFVANAMYHGGSLLCAFKIKGAAAVWLIEHTLEMSVNPTNLSIWASPVWVAGHPVRVTFDSVESYPGMRHQCRMLTGGGSSRWNLTAQSMTSRSVKNDIGMPLVNAQSVYNFSPTIAMAGGSVQCAALPSAGLRVKFVLMREYNIPIVSGPCSTSVTFGRVGYNSWWRVGDIGQILVTSLGCATDYWPVRHICWLVTTSVGGTMATKLLGKISQSSFASAHRLPVTKRMAQRNWHVRCSVNQSGIVYEDAQSQLSYQPQVYYQGNLSLVRHSIQSTDVSRKLTITIAASNYARPTISRVECNASLVSEKIMMRWTQSMQPTETNANTLDGSPPTSSLWSFSVNLMTKAGDASLQTLFSCAAVQTHQGDGSGVVFQIMRLFALPSLAETAATTTAGAAAAAVTGGAQDITVHPHYPPVEHRWQLMVAPAALAAALIAAGLLLCCVGTRKQTAVLLATANGKASPTSLRLESDCRLQHQQAIPMTHLSIAGTSSSYTNDTGTYECVEAEESSATGQSVVIGRENLRFAGARPIREIAGSGSPPVKYLNLQALNHQAIRMTHLSIAGTSSSYANDTGTYECDEAEASSATGQSVVIGRENGRFAGARPIREIAGGDSSSGEYVELHA